GVHRMTRLPAPRCSSSVQPPARDPRAGAMDAQPTPRCARAESRSDMAARRSRSAYQDLSRAARRQMTSANVPSMRRKYAMPPIKATATMTIETAAIEPGQGVPSKPQRNPSTMVAMGLRPYNGRQTSGTREAGYATGVANIQNCTANGRTYRTSRYSTLSAENQSVAASAVATARSANAGTRKKPADGVT